MRIGVYFFKECALGCLSSRFLYLNFKERTQGCGSSRFLCALSSNSNGLFGLWTWSVVNCKNVSICDDLYLDASCLLGSLYYSKLCLLLRVVIQYLFSCIWFLYIYIYILRNTHTHIYRGRVFGLYLVSLLCYHYLFLSYLILFFFNIFFSFIWLVWWVFNIFSN